MKKHFTNASYVLLLTLVLVGCGHKNNTTTIKEGETKQPEEVIAVETPSTTQDDNPADEPAENQVVLETAIDEGDFSVIDFGNGTCSINYCSSEEEEIRVPDKISGLTVIGVEQFAFNQSRAKTIVLPNSIEYIESYAFSGCENLVSASLGEGLVRVGEMVFNDCNKIQSLSFPESLKSFDYMPIGFCDALQEVFIPASVTNISDGITLLEMCPNVIIVTPSGSVAETVALEYELPVINS